MGEKYIEDINAVALDCYPPDLTVFLNISPERAFERKHGADKGDRMEQQGINFHRRVYEGYLSLLKKYPRICAVECGGTKYETAERVFALLKEKGLI